MSAIKHPHFIICYGARLMKKKLTIIGLAFTSVFFISGCANHIDVEDRLNELTNQVTSISSELNSTNAKLNQTSTQAKDTKNIALSAKKEAERANKRLDNLASSYKK